MSVVRLCLSGYSVFFLTSTGAATNKLCSVLVFVFTEETRLAINRAPYTKSILREAFLPVFACAAAFDVLCCTRLVTLFVLHPVRSSMTPVRKPFLVASFFEGPL